MTSSQNGWLAILLSAFFGFSTSLAAMEKPSPTPVTLTDRDLESLSPAARKEIEELIRHKHENPDPPPTRIRFGQGQGAVKGDIGPGGVQIELLGGTFQFGRKARQRVPKPVAHYRPDQQQLLFPDDLIISIIKRGNEPMFVTVEKSGFKFTIPAEQLEQMIDQYKPYVTQMLMEGLMNSGGESGNKKAKSDGAEVDLGVPSSDLGKPSEIPDSDLGKPAPLPPDPQPEKPQD